MHIFSDIPAITKVKFFSPAPLSFCVLRPGFQVSVCWPVTDPVTILRITFRVSRHGTQIRGAAQRSEAYSKCIAFAYSIPTHQVRVVIDNIYVTNKNKYYV